MAFKATRNMPFSLVLQKLSSFFASSEIFNIVLFMVYFVAVILKVFLVNLLAALNFANVFLNKKRLENKKNVKKRKKRDQNKKKRKRFFYIHGSYNPADLVGQQVDEGVDEAGGAGGTAAVGRRQALLGAAPARQSDVDGVHDNVLGQLGADARPTRARRRHLRRRPLVARHRPARVWTHD